MPLPRSLALVLAALARGHLHGFDIMDATGLPSGTVYPNLRRLEREGLVEGCWEERGESDRGPGRPTRRVYRLTPSGTAAAAEARGRLAEAQGRVEGLLAPEGGS